MKLNWWSMRDEKVTQNFSGKPERTRLLMHRCEEISKWVLQKFRFVIGEDSSGSGECNNVHSFGFYRNS
jgi:hypothetical protein